ncbi:SIR2 family NAD-dependent protein deacylase [Pengzhenrongella sicca]|uniref:protein acetyllysine N-acetyltransferase n=1 Tax=Pengzhenrongella sicca TaxID=2819238 RepID=A0A8A4ZBM1_9MICO|nr:Sir2 family NAD-dependent protein deacetylase [Pengzhenrongella sicca]QTE29284.1 Sir2 family NAD-dependent protein deacetylase [Pengzhenrongella sicca]
MNPAGGAAPVEPLAPAEPLDPAAPRAPWVTVLTGAGISTGSGIPDFRGPDGVWTRDPLASRLLEHHYYVADGAIRRRTWQMWRESPVWQAAPTPAHRSLVQLERAGALRAVCTQNFDGLHQLAGSSPALVLELHGSLPQSRCLDCGAAEPTAQILARLDTDPDPHCAICDGPLATDVVMFGEALPGAALDAAVSAARTCEVFLVVGSTLTVEPVASLTAMAANAGARVVIVNAEPTPYDELAERVDRRPIQDALPEIVGELVAEHAG